MSDQAALDRRSERDKTDDSPADNGDPRQLILPYVDTAIDLADGRLPMKLTVATAVVVVPAVAALVVGLYYLNTGNYTWGLPLLVLGTALAVAAGISRLSSSWAAYPHERIIDSLYHTVRQLRLPWGYQAALEHADQLHGVREIGTVSGTDIGAVWTHDGRMAVPVRVRTGNTTLVEPGEVQHLARTLTEHFNAELGGTETTVTLHSTTRPETSAAASKYQERAQEGWLTRLEPYEAGLLGSIGAWIEDRDRETGANDTRHYLLVEIDVDDYDTTEEQERAITQKVTQAEAVFEVVEGANATTVSPREVLNLVASYWGRSEFPAGRVGEAAARAAILPGGSEEEAPGTTPTERCLTPQWYDEGPHHVEVGEDVVARTLWISNWPSRPEPKFLQQLWTMPGVDLDVTIHLHPLERERVRESLKRIVPRIDAEGMERAEQMSVGSLTLDDKLDYYILAYKLLEESHTEPWDLSAYVTVRAPDLDRLDEACKKVRKQLINPPAECVPAAPYAEQHVTFRSAAPFTADQYGEKGTPRRRARKTHTAFGGVFGALMPGAAAAVEDPDGIRWGRDSTTRRTVQADPFDRGPGPHLVTVGPTGSGKTFSVKQATQEWWLNGDDRTVVYCDTQGGFEDVVEAFDADHIVIDGQTGINPFDIRPAAGHNRIATDGGYNQYRLKVDETTEFFCSILRSHGVEAGDYHSAIEHAVEQTFAEAGITADPETHDKPSPGPAAFFDTLNKMSDSPEEFTFSGGETEAADLQQRISGLLNELSGFKPGGKYHHILEGTNKGIGPDTDLAYLDMRHLAGEKGSDKSASLQLAVGQLTQFIKQADGQTIFVVDEAHNLLHSEEMVAWLDKAAREWRRYDAALWFVTQSPKDFVAGLGDESEQETILEQCSTIQLMNCAGVDADVLARLGVPVEHAPTVQESLIPGDTGKSYSECVLSVPGERGWIRTEVEASPIHKESIEFSHRGGRTYSEQMQAALDTDG